MRVLEMGAGHAAPGTAALLVLGEERLRHAVFTDYNADVLQDVTMRNVEENLRRNELRPLSTWMCDRLRWLAGDWMDVSRELTGSTTECAEFDLILAAEVTYREELTEKVVRFLDTHLAHTEEACALIAAKRFYFGTGGSVAHLKDTVVGATHGRLRAETVATFNDGASNIREVVKISRDSS